MARIQTMIVPSAAGEAVAFVVIIDECLQSEIKELAEANDCAQIKDTFGARGVLIYAGTLDVV